MNAMKKAITPERDEKVLEKKWNGKRIIRDGLMPSVDHGIDFSSDPGMTDQSQTADCDVNTIVSKYMKTGVLPGSDIPGLYGDFAEVNDFHESMNLVLRAQEQFDGLSADVRKRFANDPSLFLEFVGDPQNAQEMIKLGLATERPTLPPKTPPKPEASTGPILDPVSPETKRAPRI